MQTRQLQVRSIFFIAVRPRKGDYFSKTTNQDDNEHKESNPDFDDNTNKNQSKNK